MYTVYLGYVHRNATCDFNLHHAATGNSVAHPISLRTRLIVGRDTCKLGHLSSNEERVLLAISSSFSKSNWFNISIISLVNFLGLVLRGISISFPVSLYFLTRLKRLCKLIEMFSSLNRFLFQQ